MNRLLTPMVAPSMVAKNRAAKKILISEVFENGRELARCRIIKLATSASRVLPIAILILGSDDDVIK